MKSLIINIAVYDNNQKDYFTPKKRTFFKMSLPK